MSENLQVPGFRAGAVCAGLRKGAENRLDLALMVCDTPASAAGTFTKNLVRAAPVILSERRLKSGRAQAILANAGCANAMTGARGIEASEKTTARAADLLDIGRPNILAASTGVIGTQLNVEHIENALPGLVESVRPEGIIDAAAAIMTTDKVSKAIRTTFKVGNKCGTLVGIAKGAGMIAPDMATMLAFLFTDAAAAPGYLRKVLKGAVERSFNRVRVDGDTSTNDCAIILAGGALGNGAFEASSARTRAFERALEDACFHLAAMMARDGEGATRVMDLRVAGAASDADAVKIGKAIADSPLVKTALHGADPNWGRIAAAAGRAGVKFNIDKMKITIGGLPCVRKGVPASDFDEKSVAKEMQKPTVLIEVSVGSGKGSARFISSDLTAEYIRINAHYRT